MDEGTWNENGTWTMDRLASMRDILAVPKNVTPERAAKARVLGEAVESAMLTARVHLMFAGRVYEASTTISDYGYTPEVAQMALRRLVARGDATYNTDGRLTWFACKEEAHDGSRTRRGTRPNDGGSASGQLALF